MMDHIREDGADYSPAEIVVPRECAGMRLDAVLARLLPDHSRSRLQAWVKEGLVQVDGTMLPAKHKILGGERLSVSLPSAGETMAPAEDIALPILYEDEVIVVIDKPAGLVVHPGNGNWSGTLMNALLHHVPEVAVLPRAGIVHRLDKETSGLLVVAKTLTAQTDLVRQMQARAVRRCYLALVHGQVGAGGTVDMPLGRHPVQRTKMAVVKHGTGGKEARTHYEVRERFEQCTLVECRLETGRTHQIRVHMASIGHPLVGDPTYGKSHCRDARLAAFTRQALHAWRLALKHPVTADEMGWESALPEDFAGLLGKLRAS